MKKALLFLSLTFLYSFIFGQGNVDSLKRELQTATKEKEIIILNELAVSLKKTNPTESFNYASEALQKATEIGEKEGQSEAYYNMGVASYFKSDFTDALVNYENALVLKRELNDSVYEAKLLYNIGLILHKQADFEKAAQYYQQSLEIEEAVDNKPNIARIVLAMGVINMNWSNHAKAEEYFNEALELYSLIGDRLGIANANMNIGLNKFNSTSPLSKAQAENQSDAEKEAMSEIYKEAVTYYERALAEYEAMGYLANIALVLNNISVVYKKMNDNVKSIDFAERSLEVSEKMGDKMSMALTYGNLGSLYFQNKDFANAIEYNDKSIRLARELNLKEIEKETYRAYTDIYEELGRYKEALWNHRRYAALKDSLFSSETQKQFTEMQTKYETDKKEKEIELLNKDKVLQDNQIKQQQTLILVFISVSVVILVFLILLVRMFTQKKKANMLLAEQNEEILQQKEEIQTQAEQLRFVNVELEKLSIVASETDNSVIIADANGKIEWVNEGFMRLMGYTYDEFVNSHGDNLIDNSKNPNIREAIAESISKGQSAVYTAPTTTKDGRVVWLQTTLTPILASDGTLSKLVAIDSDISKIKEAEEEIKKQHDLILDQRQEILDSIHYARRIQTAVLPLEEIIINSFSDHFILYKPRDIVSGDFYWFTSKGHKTVIAAADCTGHGVPGAFMSMLGVSFLNEIVNKKALEGSCFPDNECQDVINASEILDQLRDSVIRSLHQTGKSGESKDGMDIALCIVDHETKQMQYAGANNPVYIVDPSIQAVEDELELLTEIKGDKMPIGIYYSAELEPFTTKEVQLQKGQTVYIFSDGYADQFGGNKGKKFKYKSFKQLLIKNRNKTLSEQKEILNETFENWRGDIEQIDDIIVIGFRI